MPVVCVGGVEMSVLQPGMCMPVAVGLARRVAGDMQVPVVRVVHVPVDVFDRFVLVLMFVPLGKVQPDASRHQQAGDAELH
jgi:hypothetical protein